MIHVSESAEKTDDSSSNQELMQNPSYEAQMSAWVICEIKQMSQVTLQSKTFLIRAFSSKMKGVFAVISLSAITSLTRKKLRPLITVKKGY